MQRLLIVVLAALFPAGLGCLGDVDVLGQPDAGLVIEPDGDSGKPDSQTDGGQGDPCQGMVCDTPPGPCFADTGVCQNGFCEYAVLNDTPCDDGDACTHGDSCSQGLCRGTPLICTDPPSNTCADTDHMRVYDPIGSCVDGFCFYDSSRVFCPEGCLNGLCLGDPCLGVDCSQAPGECYQSPGTCVEGSCHYELADGQACDDGDPCTQLDQCGGGICQGQVMVCNQPPGPQCLDQNHLVSYGSSGHCQQGACAYPETAEECEDGCWNGACQHANEPAILSSSHTGWTEQDCYQSGCHSASGLTQNHEPGLESPDCVQCHGANGACYSCGRTYSCSSCHGYKHGFSSTTDCRTCHEATEGLRNCY